MALDSNEALAAAHSERAAAELDHRAARRQRWPALDLGGAYTQFDNAPLLQIQTPGAQLQAPLWKHDGYASAGADLSVPLWTSGRISGAIGAASAGERGARARESLGTSDLKLAVAEAYIAVFRAQKALDVAVSSVASLGEHARDVQVMYDKQAVTRADLLGAQVALANAEQQRLRAANSLHLATAAYNRWVGQPLGREPALEEPRAPAGAQDTPPLPPLMERALENRQELAALDSQRLELEQAARSERARGLPQVALHAGYNHFDNLILDRENFASVGLSVTWRVFDSGQLSASTQSLRNRAHAAAQRLADLRSQIALEVETAYYNRQEADARMQAALASVQQAEENLRIAEELYGSGLASNNQVLDAETLRVMARSNQDGAKYDRVLADYRLQHALGTL